MYKYLISYITLLHVHNKIIYHSIVRLWTYPHQMCYLWTVLLAGRDTLPL